MKIAILSPFLHRGGGHGGITVWLLNISNALRHLDQEVELLISAPTDRSLEHPRLAPGIKIINLGNRKHSLYKNLLRYLGSQRPQVLVSAGYRYHFVVAVTLLFVNTAPKWVLSVHEHASQATATLSPGKRLRRRLALRWAIGRADHTLGVSADLVDDLIRHWGLAPDKASHIHNAVVDRRIVKLGQEKASHAFFDGGGKVLLSVGRLERQKDYPSLFQAFAELSKTMDVRLIVLGEGSLKRALQAQIEALHLTARIDLAGFVDNPYAYMRQADALVLSSRWEGFGNVLAEAMAQGTAVVATDCPSGPAEILDQGRYGPLVPVGDIPALTAGMRQVLLQPLAPDTLRRRAQAFDVQARARDYLKLFHRLTDDS